MRIMVFMTNHCDRLDRPSLPTQTPVFRPRPSARAYWGFLCAVAYSWVAVSTHATVSPLASQSRPGGLAVATSALSVIPGLEPFYPVLGLLAAVACTYILRRRRAAQLEAISAAER